MTTCQWGEGYIDATCMSERLVSIHLDRVHVVVSARNDDTVLHFVGPRNGDESRNGWQLQPQHRRRASGIQHQDLTVLRANDQAAANKQPIARQSTTSQSRVSDDSNPTSYHTCTVVHVTKVLHNQHRTVTPCACLPADSLIALQAFAQRVHARHDRALL